MLSTFQDESIVQKANLAEDLKTAKYDRNSLKQSKDKTDGQQNIQDKNFVYECLSHCPDGKTNYEKLTMEDNVDLDDEFGDSDDDCSVDSDSDENVDSTNGDKINTHQGTSETNDDSDCEIVFDDSAEGIQIHN